ncbi:MAG: glycosyl transferase [Bauldia sp.]|nr:glycosyl transferase [Bauldia sp.]
MIPKIIHQTWKTDEVPAKFAGWVESWRRLNPGYEYRLWTDRMLLDFVAEKYPDFLPVYAAYPQPIMRADAGRYLLLHHFGGIYADLDTECLAPFDPIMDEDRVVLAHEPPTNWAQHNIASRAFSFLLFNGLMASPAGHPFWVHLAGRMYDCRFAQGVLDATGPFLLTGAYNGFADKASVAVYPAQLFNPVDSNGIAAPDYAPNPVGTLASHYWEGTWFKKPPRRRSQHRINWWRGKYFALRHHLSQGEILDPAEERARVGPEVVASPSPAGGRVAILVPVRDAAQHIGRLRGMIEALDYPKELLKIVFCEGDSVDRSRALLEEAVGEMRPRYRDAVLLRYEVAAPAGGPERWKPHLQRRRRGNLARVRNHLIDGGLDASDDWALWIDVDLWAFPPRIVQRLLEEKARIVAPHCTVYPGGPTYDANSFIAVPFDDEYILYRNMKDGLLQPEGSLGKVCMDGLRHSERVYLDAVGGTMLLVDAGLHRGGLRFPEKPYRGHIETEGLGLLARDLGIRPVGLPRVEIHHVPW